MPGPGKVGFSGGGSYLNGKLLLMAGYSVIDRTGSPSAEVYQYDSCLNRISDRTKHRKSSAYTAQVIRSATSFVPWPC
ncbi:hypothetical protein L6164_034354 [Bauhinia variegata]|uniref:Uncharacterized protein n=1 Tax=Bauhinia variegata TaxID=167791 RepID=A0ACB9KUZ5_BAUVA|nr:hypothetical protein L6164_034354 [Bauhinia variegata]